MQATATAWGERFELAQPAYQRKISTFSRKNFTSLPGYGQVDLEQELLEVLWLACGAYDPDNGSGFNNFFWTCAKRRFLDLHKAASREKRVGDYSTVSMQVEDVGAAVEQMFQEASSEEQVLALFTAREVYNSRRR